jgi:branched-chain amino acid transport system substrate-binding protein
MKTPALAIALALGLSTSAFAADELVIGFESATTGPYISNSGQNVIALQMAVDKVNAAGGVNGKKLKLSVFDTAGNPQQAQVAVRRFAEDEGALGIIGPFSSGEARVAFPAGERLGIVQISNSSSAPGITKGFKFAFRNTNDEDSQFDKLLLKMKDMGQAPKQAVIAYASDEFVSKSLGTTTFPAALKKYGIDVVKSVDFPLASFDLSPQISQMQQTPHDTVALSSSIDSLVKFVREMRRQGDKSRIIGSGLLADPALPEKLGPDGDGTLYPTYYFYDLNDKMRAFNKEFGEKSKAAGFTRTIANHTDASGFDVVNMFVYAMKKANVTGDKDKVAAERLAIRDILEKMEPLEGVLGAVNFSADHDARMPIYIIEVRNSKSNLIATFPPQ